MFHVLTGDILWSGAVNIQSKIMRDSDKGMQDGVANGGNKQRKSNTIKIFHKRHTWTTISNAEIEDRRLSWGARGMFPYIHGRPNGWVLNFKDLVNRSDVDGKTKVQNYINELKKHGYLKIIKIKDEHGRFTGEVHWITNEQPGKRDKNDSRSRRKSTFGEDAKTEAPYPHLPADGNTELPYTGTITNNIFYKQKRQQQSEKINVSNPDVVVFSGVKDIRKQLTQIDGAFFRLRPISILEELCREHSPEKVLFVAEKLTDQYKKRLDEVNLPGLLLEALKMGWFEDSRNQEVAERKTILEQVAKSNQEEEKENRRRERYTAAERRFHELPAIEKEQFVASAAEILGDLAEIRSALLAQAIDLFMSASSEDDMAGNT